LHLIFIWDGLACDTTQGAGGKDLDLSDEEKLALADLLRGAIDAYR